MTAPLNSQVQSIAEMRRVGRLNEVLADLNRLLAEYPDDPCLLQEGLLSALLTNATDAAYRIYVHLAPTAAKASTVDTVAAARLALTMPGARVVLPPPAQSEPAWLVRYRQTGEDVQCDGTVRSVQVSVMDENAVFDFTVTCSSCGSDSTLKVCLTLASEQNRLCPACLARQRVTVATMSAAVAEEADARLGDAGPSLDHAAHDVLQAIYVDDRAAELPMVCRLLGHDYLPLLNQFLVSRTGSEEVTRP